MDKAELSQLDSMIDSIKALPDEQDGIHLVQHKRTAIANIEAAKAAILTVRKLATPMPQ